jgi:hypothetical protein
LLLNAFRRSAQPGQSRLDTHRGRRLEPQPDHVTDLWTVGRFPLPLWMTTALALPRKPRHLIGREKQIGFSADFCRCVGSQSRWALPFYCACWPSCLTPEPEAGRLWGDRAAGVAAVRKPRLVDALEAITATTNTGSVAFHERLGFSAEVVPDYAGPGQARVLFSLAMLPDGH